MAGPKNLSHLSIEALTKLRDDVAAALSRKAEVLEKELVAIGSGYAEVGRVAMSHTVISECGSLVLRNIAGRVPDHD
jgi:hypothetical protein